MYDVFVFHRSYFCGKLLAYLRYKEIPFRPIYGSLSEYGATIQANTGLRQMPVVRTADGTWLQDTTPMIDWFEEQHPELVPILPPDPVVGFLCRLLEDYGDEWLWRSAIYYRWAFAEDRSLYKKLFVREFLGAPWSYAAPLTWLAGKLVHRHQNEKFLWGDGMTRKNREHVESVYLGTLERLEQIFQEQPYLLGDRPSLADYGFFGSMFYHFSNDPTPNRLMQDRASGVYEWVARMWNARAGRLSARDARWTYTPGEAPANWEPLLADVCANYLPYLYTNARAFAAGERRFDWQVQGFEYPGVHASPYRVWCRERLQQHLRALPLDAQTKLREILEPLGGWEPLTAEPQIASDWDPEGIVPLCRPAKIPLMRRLLAPVTGSNHIRTRRAWRKAK